MYSLGIDVGTSGIRAVVMDQQQDIIAQAQSALPASLQGYTQNPADWWNTFETVVFQIKQELSLQDLHLDLITHLAIDGTSGTVLLANASGTPCSDALMYNDQRSVSQAQSIQEVAPDNTAAIGSTSGLAKLLWLYENWLYEHSNDTRAIHYALNQSDWISGKLMNKYGYSDHNNALKMGYDAEHQCWPDWLIDFLKARRFPISILPKVLIPGQIMGRVSATMADHLGFSRHLNICAGTTDSTAAIMASGVSEVGEAVTSLGSTLVMKVISRHPVFDQISGVYSQPYGDLWLVGGASNSGGAVLKSLFCYGEIADHTQALNSKITQDEFAMMDLNYYPLLSPGERFPVQDSNLEPRLTPRPERDIDFFQALLEGMADIETKAYQRLLELGAPYPKRVTSIGGGSFNKAWRYIRQKKMGVDVVLADQEHAAAGAALLAQKSW